MFLKIMPVVCACAHFPRNLDSPSWVLDFFAPHFCPFNIHETMAAPANHGDVLSMILVMGVTGSGKSYFINKLAGSDVVETGEKLKSCKSQMRPPPWNTSSLLIE